MTADLTGHAAVLVRVGFFGGFAGVLAFLLLWEDGRPLAAPPPNRWRHRARNAGLFLVTLCVIVPLFSGVLPGDTAAIPGLPPGLLSPLDLSVGWLVAAGFVVADLMEYLFHRLCHRWRWLWLIHAVHHSDPHVDATTGLRFHPLEVTLQISLKLVAFALLGVPLWVEAVRAIVFNPLDFAQHANVSYPDWVERRLRWLIMTPALHRLHHSPMEAEANSNFGPGFSLWDRLFGTFRHPQGERPLRYGLSKLTSDSWQTVGGMLLTPLTARGMGTL